MIFFVGPTGVGKSAYAHQLALQHGASILNCDSIQMYQEVSVGAAKPTQQERREVPHFLLDCIAPLEKWTAADFCRAAHPILEKELKARPVFAVGGSGFYIRALEKGLYELPALSKEKQQEIKKLLDLKSDQDLHKDLAQHDLESAKKLHVNDRYRVERALVIFYGLGLKTSEVQKEFVVQALPYETMKIGLWIERDQLRSQMAARIKKMNAAGFREEVESLLKKGLQDWWPLHSVGYQEWVEGIQKGETEAKVTEKILISHMQLAKKQMTWFKKDPTILWMHAKKDQAKLMEAVARFLETGVNPCKA